MQRLDALVLPRLSWAAYEGRGARPDPQKRGVLHAGGAWPPRSSAISSAPGHGRGSMSTIPWVTLGLAR
jgi:hypothetical protein